MKAKGLWISDIFTDVHGNEHPITTFDFAPAKAAGIKFVVGEMANGLGRHNRNWDDMVQAAANVGLPIFGSIKFNIVDYYLKYNEAGFWDSDDFIAGDERKFQYLNAIRHKQMKGVILQFYEDISLKNGDQLQSDWVKKVVIRTLARLRKHSATTNRRLTSDRIWPMLSDKMVTGNVHLETALYGKELYNCAKNNAYHKSVRTYDYSEILNLQVTDKPELAFCKDWLFWYNAQSTVSDGKYTGFQVPHIILENGGEAVIGAVEFNGDNATFDAMFSVNDVPTPDPEPKPDDPPEPEKSTIQLISESVKRLADIHGTIADMLEK